MAQLPPPVTGLSAVNARMIQEFETAGLLASSIDIAPPRSWPSPLKPLGRFAKTMAALLSLIPARIRGARTLYMPCDGGSGLAFNVLLAASARLLRYDLWTHHHSFAYLNERSALMAAFLRLSPRGTRHIVLCERMTSRLAAQYPLEWLGSDAKSIALSNAFMAATARNGEGPEGELVLGHLSNLTEDKGALRFLDLFARLRRKGIFVKGKIAGPAHDPKVKAAIQTTAAEFPDTFQWLGPLYGADKDAFYENIDVFVFPSSYANEAQPLVLLEALARGAAVLTTDRGCMGCDHKESPGAVFSEADFTAQAEQWIHDLIAGFDRAELARSAMARFCDLKQEADRSLSEIISEI